MGPLSREDQEGPARSFPEALGLLAEAIRGEERYAAALRAALEDPSLRWVVGLMFRAIRSMEDVLELADYEKAGREMFGEPPAP